MTINTSNLKLYVYLFVKASDTFAASGAAAAVVYNGHAVVSAPAISSLGLGSAYASETGTLKIDFVKANGTSYVSGINPGDSVKVQITIGGTLQSAAADVSVVVDGKAYKDGDWITANSDLEVQRVNISLTPKLAIDGAATAKGLSADGRTLTITFNQKISKADGSEPSVSDIVDGNVLSKIVSVEYGADDQLVIKFSEPLADGNKVKIPNNFIGSGVADNDIDGNAVIRINVSDGKYQDCTVVAS